MDLLKRVLESRHSRILKLLEKYEKPWIVLSREVSSWMISDANFEYITGSKNVAPAAAIAYDGVIEAMVHKMDAGMFEEFPGKLYTYQQYDELLAWIKERIRGKEVMADFVELKHERKAFSTLDSLTAAMKEFLSKHAQLSSAEEFVLELRGVKTDEEIEALKKAAEYSYKIAQEIPSFIIEGITERELASKIYAEIRRYGEPSFPVIVAFLENTANPHHHPGDRRLDRKGPILVDFGVRYASMCSDTTWMYHYGEPSEEFLIVLETVYDAKRHSEELIKPGVTGKQVHEACMEFLRDRGYDRYMIHSLGHPLGLETHDIGVGLNKYADKPLSVNSVVTVEPGIYFYDRPIDKRFGVRLEDDVAVRPDGVERLIHVPKTAIIVRAFYGGSLPSSAISSRSLNLRLR